MKKIIKLFIYLFLLYYDNNILLNRKKWKLLKKKQNK